MNFSILMSVYYKEMVSNVERCIKSIFQSTMLPSQIVIVTDGPQNDQMNVLLESLRKDKRFLIVGYEFNRGLGYALDFGLSFVDHDLVMRMDTDDVVLPYRFELQSKFMIDNDLDISSGFIEEYQNIDNGKPLGIRKVPLNIREINKQFPWRSPFNHMAVCFRKSAIKRIGGYESIDLYEDYYLWWKAYNVLNYANIDKILVRATFDYRQIARRSGILMLKRELVFQFKCFLIHKRISFLLIGFVRVFVRLVPAGLMKKIYSIFLRSR